MDITRISELMNAFLILGILSTGSCMQISADWFQAQSHCASKNQTLTTIRTMPGPSYWTAHYQRLSHWIALIGCFSETQVMQHAAIKATMGNSSAGYCQEICMKSNMSIFAIKDSTCICLRKLDIGSENSARKCNLSCTNNIDGKFARECGGETTFNVFKSRRAFGCSPHLSPAAGYCVAIQCISTDPNYYCTNCSLPFSGLCQPGDSSNLIKNITYLPWENSMKTCKEDYFGYLLGNLPLSSASNACNQINKTDGFAWIGVAKQMYQGVDQGYSINTGEIEKFIKCEKCHKGNGCSFISCTSENNSVICSNVTFTTVTYPPPTTTTGRVTSTEKTEVTTKATTTTTTTKAQSTRPSTITATDTIDISAIIVPIIIILFGAIFGGTGFICWRHRKAKKVRESVSGKQENYLNANQTENKHINNEANNVFNSSYFILEPKFSYEECGNAISQTENPYIEAKEGEYDHLGNSNNRREVIDIDNYVETTKTEKKETEEGNYDHLGNAPSRSNIVEDTYCHTSPNQLDSSSDYDVANHTEQRDTQNTYDHTGALVHLQNNSNYDYSELKR